jgi:two-component sensor histidine kinase
LALLLLGIGGLALSTYVAIKEAEQYRSIERLRLVELVDNHFATVQDHFALRLTLATTVAAVFHPQLTTPRPLDYVGNQIVALLPDLATLRWMPEVDAAHAQEALAGLRASGIPRPFFFDAHNNPIDPETVGRPLFPVIDATAEPKEPIIGLDAATFPARLAAINTAREKHEVVRLESPPESDTIILYAPVYEPNGRFTGVLGFGFTLEKLMSAALKTAPLKDGLCIQVYTEGFSAPLVTLDSTGNVRRATVSLPDSPRTAIDRTMDFGGHSLTFTYSVNRDVGREGMIRGLVFAASGVALTGGAIILLGLIANRATALGVEVHSRRSAEDRLKVLIHELNHRVRNVLSVAQAVVRLSFTPGLSLEAAQHACEGRLQALANAMALLTASEWKSISLRSLITSEILPFAERIEVRGPDIPLKARAAQTFALLLHELATNAAKHGALSVADGKVSLRWMIDRSLPQPTFRLTWKEMDGPPVKPPLRRGFGELLVRRIAPHDVAGRGTARYEPSGFSYELEAPLSEVTLPEAERKITL